MYIPNAIEITVNPMECKIILMEGSVPLTSGTLNNAIKGVTGLIATKKDKPPLSDSGLYKTGDK
jgi:hypothetical protein